MALNIFSASCLVTGNRCTLMPSSQSSFEICKRRTSRAGHSLRTGRYDTHLAVSIQVKGTKQLAGRPKPGTEESLDLVANVQDLCAAIPWSRHACTTVPETAAQRHAPIVTKNLEVLVMGNGFAPCLVGESCTKLGAMHRFPRNFHLLHIVWVDVALNALVPLTLGSLCSDMPCLMCTSRSCRHATSHE